MDTETVASRMRATRRAPPVLTSLLLEFWSPCKRRSHAPSAPRKRIAISRQQNLPEPRWVWKSFSLPNPLEYMHIPMPDNVLVGDKKFRFEDKTRRWLWLVCGTNQSALLLSSSFFVFAYKYQTFFLSNIWPKPKERKKESLAQYGCTKSINQQRAREIPD